MKWAPSSNSSAQSPLPCPRAFILWFARCLALGNLGIVAVIMWATGPGDKVTGCGGETLACDELLAGRWSRWLGLPVALPAALLYCLTLLGLFGVCWERWPRLQRVSWQQLLIVAVTLLASVCWFSGLQLWEGRFCPYCLTAHAFALVLAALILWQAPIQWRRLADPIAIMGAIKPARAFGLLLVGLAASGALIGGQVLVKPQSMRFVRLTGSLGAPINLDVNEHPRLGKVDAKHVVVELYTYNCSHCRVMDDFLEQARRRYGDQLAIVTLVVPLHPGCNAYVKTAKPGSEHACEFARLAVAVWEAKADQFENFHHWLMESEPTPQQARRRAEDLIGANALTKVLEDGSVDRRIAYHVRVYASFGGGQLPKVIYGGHAAQGAPGGAQELFSFLEKNVGLTPPP
jgi:uncharacterized membrane protein/protein-disulfide isomerase